MQQGAGEQVIIDFLVARYGDFVLYRPPFKLATVLLWLGPPILLSGALAALLRRLSRLRAAAEVDLSAAEHERAAKFLAGNGAERS